VPQGGTTTPATPDASACRSMIATVLADQVAVDHDQQAVTMELPTLSAAIDKFMAAARTNDQSQPLQSPRPLQNSQPGAKAASTGVSTDRSARATASSAGGTNHTNPPACLGRTARLRSGRYRRCPGSANRGATGARPGRAAQPDRRRCRFGDHQRWAIRAGSSSTPQIVIIGPGAHQVTTSVSDINVGSVRVGATATVVPSGSSAPLHGQVVSIGMLASSGSSPSTGSINYPVTIGLTSTDEQLFTGQSASVSIMLAHASGILTVPSSAVHHAGAGNIVSVLRNGTPSNVLVTLGAAGPTRTQVLAGLNAGEQVILADLSQPLPTGDIQNLRRVTGGGNGRPGG
jgi:hypothetical protein